MNVLQNGVAAAALLGVALFAWSGPSRHQPPGQVAPQQPRQYDVDSMASVAVGAFSLKPRARFDMEARVLSRERYWLGATGSLMPIDIAFGWGAMSDSTLIDRLHIDQGGRWYTWRFRSGDGPHDVVVRNSANMHLIPADSSVAKILFKAHVGDVVELSGYLVDVWRDGHEVITTSLTRDDSGAGACEVIYVTAATIRP